jgi:lysophospholipase L1-like esterase
MPQPIYLALGDSMSIDLYTGKVGGGAVNQFHQWLGAGWQLIDHTVDGCTISYVRTDIQAELITLTIGGNDAIARYHEMMAGDLTALLSDHLHLLQQLRATNPDACLIVGNVYAPQTPLPPPLEATLDRLNAGLAENIRAVGGEPVDIRGAFRGHEATFMCNDIEPSLVGATEIARLFREAYTAWAHQRATR